MATLVERIAALSTAIANFLRDMVLPALVPGGGDTGQVLGKASSANHDLAWIDAGVADLTSQNLFLYKKFSMWLPNDGNTATTIGTVALTAIGTAVTRYSDATSPILFKRMKRIGYVSSAAANNLAGLRLGSEQIAIGNGALGGFTTVIRFGCSDAAAVAGARQWCGITNFQSVLNVEPSTLTASIGVGHGSADTNLKLFYGGSAAQPPIDLGENFPANTLSVDVYELTLHSPRLSNGVVNWRLLRMNTGHVAEGQLSDVTGVALPSTSTGLSPIRCWRTNNATALAVAIDIMHHGNGTDY